MFIDDYEKEAEKLRMYNYINSVMSRNHHPDMFGGPGRGPHDGGPGGFAGPWREAGRSREWEFQHKGGWIGKVNDDSLRSLFHKCMGKIRISRNQPSTQDMILRILYEEGDLSQRILQGVLNMQPGSMSEILAKLEAKDYIQRTRDREDKRRVVISLTDSGREYIKDKLSDDRDAFAKNLTDEEKETLRDLLKKILD